MILVEQPRKSPQREVGFGIRYLLNMHYGFQAIEAAMIPQATEAEFQHLADTYASEINTVFSTWRAAR